MKRRVVVTGMGVISPAGNDVNTFWKSLCAGVSTADRITKFDPTNFETQFACEVKGFDPLKYIDKKSVRRMDGFVHYAIAAASQSISDAKLDLNKEDLTKIGVVVGSGIGGLSTLEDQVKVFLERGPSRVSPFFIPMMLSNMASGQISIIFGLKGPSACIVTACATGNSCIGESFKLIQYGDADVMVAGGTEYAITQLAVSGFCAARALSIRNDDPKRASRPFDKNRNGFVIGEGAGIIILEELEHALKRGVPIYCELIGYGLSSDAYHITSPAPGGEGGALAMANAIKDANLKPEDIDYINAHGTSTLAGDISETDAIKKTFKEHSYKLAISANKSMIGHLLGAAGGVEGIATVLTIKNSIIPPTINYEEKDPQCDLNYVPNKAMQKEVKVALSNSFGFGGHNATIVLKRYE
ncbi:MAG: beta-ketoacyl-ACP synthase II [Candidatus Firestonebacteria bacterium]